MELMTVSTSNCEKRICVSMCMWGVGEEGGGGGGEESWGKERHKVLSTVPGMQYILKNANHDD